MCKLSPVTFHGDTIFCVTINDTPFAPMRPIVENMGLNWASQTAKLNANKERWSVANIATVAQDGKERETLCMPVRKLPAFLASINPKKVRPELRERIELYQNECDDALWNYWTQGRAERAEKMADATITPDQQCTLQNIVRAKVEAMPEEQRRGGFPAIWSRFNNHFRLAKYSQLPQERMADAIAYLMALKLPAIEAPKPQPEDNKGDFYKCLGEYVNGFGEMVDEVHKKLTSRGNYFSMLMHIDKQARNMEVRGMDSLAVQTLHDYTYMATCGANMLLKAIDGFNHLRHACNFR